MEVFMSDPDALESVNFSKAKSGLSVVMDDVVHARQPRLVQRHGGRESMLLVRPDDLIRSLEQFRLAFTVTIEPGEVTVAVPEFGVLGFGDDLDSAMKDLVAELRAYSRRFFERSAFYLETDRASHYPKLLRFALTHPDEQLDLLYQDADVAAGAPKQAALVR
jgi:hypothetical protein